MASVSILVNQAQCQINKNITSGIDVFKLYEENHQLATKLVNLFYDNLAIGITNIVHINNPQIVILGGGITNRPSFLEELMPFIKKHLRKWEFDQTIIKIAQFKNDAGMIGAFQHFKKSTISKKRPSE